MNFLTQNKNSLIIVSAWFVILIITILFYFLEPPFIPPAISRNLWVLPVCMLPFITIILEDQLKKRQ